jgi:hypothetical protein
MVFVSPSKRRLILHVLQEHFGDIVEHLARVLLKAEEDGFTLREIMTHAVSHVPARLQPPPTPQLLKSGLLKLLQHNLLDIKSFWNNSMSSSARDGKKSNHRLPYTIRYKLDHEEALRRLRFARYIELAKEVFGDVVSIVCIQ